MKGEAVTTKAVEEIWELTIPGRVSMTVDGPGGRPKRITNKGKGSRIRIAKADRELIEEGVRTSERNPFTNGSLVRVDKHEPDRTPSPDELSDEDLLTAFEVKDEEFESFVRGLSEVNIRRLKVLAKEADASLTQSKFIDDLIEERFPLGGTTPTWDEMQASP